MTTLVIIAIAYLLTGIHYVGRDMRANPVDQPGYAREGGFSLLQGALFWLPYTIESMTSRGVDARSSSSVILFAGMVIGMMAGSSQP